VTKLQFIRREVQHTANEQWFLVQLLVWTQIEDDEILAGFEFSVKFIDSDLDEKRRFSQSSHRSSPAP
jgi:hypothetical protein